MDYTFGGTAERDVDYTGTDGTLTLGPGSNQTLPIPFDVSGDTDNEPTDTITVDLATDAEVTRGTGTVDIVDDDAPPAAETVVLNEQGTEPFTRVAYQNGSDGGDECGAGYVDDGTVDQVFVNGPGTPPAGRGSLRFTIDQAGEQQLFRDRRLQRHRHP